MLFDYNKNYLQYFTRRFVGVFTNESILIDGNMLVSSPTKPQDWWRHQSKQCIPFLLVGHQQENYPSKSYESYHPINPIPLPTKLTETY